MSSFGKNYFTVAVLLATVGHAYSGNVESKVACEHPGHSSNLRLECVRGQVISILTANYGRTSAAICQHVGRTDCHSPNSVNIVKKLCEGRQSCNVAASNAVFGDPCYGVEKYLEVKFKCKEAPPCGANEFRCEDGQCMSNESVCNGVKDCSQGDDERGCYYKSAYACEHGGELNVECPRNELIRVLHGNYGRTDAAICKPSGNTNCRSPVADSILKDRCDLKQRCKVAASNDVFGDPCYGTEKYIELHYICWAIPASKR